MEVGHIVVGKCNPSWRHGQQMPNITGRRRPFEAGVDQTKIGPIRGKRDLQVCVFPLVPTTTDQLQSVDEEPEGSGPNPFSALPEEGQLYVSGDVGVQYGSDRKIDGTYPIRRQGASGSQICNTQYGSAGFKAPSGNVDQSLESNPTISFYSYEEHVNTTKTLVHILFTQTEMQALMNNEVGEWWPKMTHGYYANSLTLKWNNINVKEPKVHTNAPLDTILASKIRFDVIRKLATLHSLPFPELKWVSTDWSEMIPKIKSNRVSHFLKEDVEMMLEASVVTLSRTEGGSPIHLFKVPKKNGTSRLIADCRIINSSLSEDAEMPLEDIRKVLDDILSCKYKCQYDGTGYFHQFPLENGAQKSFPVRIGQMRGKFSTGHLQVLPMGFKYAPSIAQKTSILLLKSVLDQYPDVICHAWIDNFMFASDDRIKLVEACRKFEKVCEEANVKVSLTSSIGETITILGTKITAEYMAPEESMISKLKVDLTTPPCSRRVLYKKIGRALWVAHSVGRVPLCMWEEVLSIMSEIGKQVAVEKTWDKLVEQQHIDSIAKFTAKAIEMKRDKDQVKKDRTSQRGHRWYSDATPTGAGIIRSGSKDEGWSLGSQKTDIFISELLAMATAAWQEKEAVIVGDNKAAVRSILKGSSRSRAANIILRKIYASEKGPASAGWVPTHAQPADKLSRGILQLGDHPNEDEIQWFEKRY